jgi:hypothetical protein
MAGPMYHASEACGDQESRCDALSWTKTLIPGGAGQCSPHLGLGVLRRPRQTLRLKMRRRLLVPHAACFAPAISAQRKGIDNS